MNATSMGTSDAFDDLLSINEEVFQPEPGTMKGVKAHLYTCRKGLNQYFAKQGHFLMFYVTVLRQNWNVCLRTGS